MTTPAEILAAHLAIIEVWQKSNNPLGSYFDCGAAAKAALEAAERVKLDEQQRQDELKRGDEMDTIWPKP